MITQPVLSSGAIHLTLFKKDSPRHIDRVIDYFGDGPPSAATSSESGRDDMERLVVNLPDGLKEGDRVVLAADTHR
jgi:hypothetical protein